MKRSIFDIASHDSLIFPSDISGYTTGNKSLDSFIHKDLWELENENLTCMSVVYLNGKVIGMFALSTTQTVAIDSEQSHKNFGKINQEYTNIPLISIDHFSVNKPYQCDETKPKAERLYTGKRLMNIIFEIIVEMKRVYNIGIAGATVEALDEAADWYEAQGFSYLDDNEEKDVKHTYKMIIGYKYIEETYLRVLEDSK